MAQLHTATKQSQMASHTSQQHSFVPGSCCNTDTELAADVLELWALLNATNTQPIAAAGQPTAH
jgi:hypothetical protein